MREKPKLLSLSLSRFQSETEKKIQIQKKKANRSRDALVISSLLVPFRAVCCAALHDWAARTLRTFFSISTLLLVIYKPSRAYNFHIITHFLLFFSLSLSLCRSKSSAMENFRLTVRTKFDLSASRFLIRPISSNVKMNNCIFRVLLLPTFIRFIRFSYSARNAAGSSSNRIQTRRLQPPTFRVECHDDFPPFSTST